MTRKEEIKQNALSKYPQGTNRYNKFIEGAEWTDKTMLDKACEWLKEHYAPAGFVEGIFRKAMEE